MPRKARFTIDYPGGLYHVINRGVNRGNIFFDPKDYIFFLESLTKTQEKFPFRLHSFCLMPNHFHLLIQTTTIGLSRILSSLLTRYALRINRVYNRVGHLFQGRCKTILCEKEPYFLELVRYISLNPIRSNLVRKPKDWLWSSYRLFCNLKFPMFKIFH
ncbi:transposase [candidate division TA06 bacterium]|nr:transposase [candidate division TA06 bacterium]